MYLQCTGSSDVIQNSIRRRHHESRTSVSSRKCHKRARADGFWIRMIDINRGQALSYILGLCICPCKSERSATGRLDFVDFALSRVHSLVSNKLPHIPWRIQHYPRTHCGHLGHRLLLPQGERSRSLAVHGEQVGPLLLRMRNPLASIHRILARLHSDAPWVCRNFRPQDACGVHPTL